MVEDPEKYRRVDAMLDEWAARHGLFIGKVYQDRPVRSTSIVDDSGSEFQLWIEFRPDTDGYTVSVWDHAARKAEFGPGGAGELGELLEKGYAQAERWIAEMGHTRTPVL